MFTMAYAKNKGVWPRQRKGAGGTPGTGDTEPGGTMPGGEPKGNEGETPPTPDPTPETEGTVFKAEGVFKEAMIRLWEQARAKKVAQIGTVSIRMFEAGDGFRLLGAIGAVAGAEKKVTMLGGYGPAMAAISHSSSTALCRTQSRCGSSSSRNCEQEKPATSKSVSTSRSPMD